jgi:DNA polymerase III alpha subunit
VFCAAILNSQPMGFYAPAQLMRDAREHGVEIRPVDINSSAWDSVLEPDANPQPLSQRHQDMEGIMKHSHAVRLGLRQVKGFGKADAAMLVDKRGRGYDSVRDLWMRSGLSRRAIEQLAEADCFRSIGLERRDALWAVKALDPLSSAERLPLFAIARTSNLQPEPDIDLPPMPLGEQVINDYQSLSFSLKAHPDLVSARTASPGMKVIQATNGSIFRRCRSGRQGRCRRAGAGAPEAGLGQGRHL